MALVLSRSLILSAAAAALPAGVPLILWDNRVTIGNVSADTEASGYPITNVANPATDPTQEWRANDATAQEIAVAVNAVDDIDGVGIARHNFGSAGIAVTIGYYDESDTWVELVQEQMPANDEPLLFRFTPQSIATLVIRLASGSAAARIAVLYVAPLLACERSFDVAADFVVPRFGRKTEVINGRAERGDYLGRIRMSQWIESELTFKHFHPDWYRENFDPFVAAAQRDVPFFLAWQPEGYPDEVVFCWFTDDPMPMTSPQTGRKSVTLMLGGITE